MRAFPSFFWALLGLSSALAGSDNGLPEALRSAQEMERQGDALGARAAPAGRPRLQ